jgi:N-acetylglucosaminyldiphosphoundecaprenol N-acetyl-beta-D-mannosaminyltransferase
MQQAVERVEHAVATRSRLLFATPNVNFVCEADGDATFATAVLNADAHFVDGAPLVLLGRLLGYRFPCRVAGSDLFESIRRKPGPAIRVFFFGGDPGVAKSAHERLQADAGRLVSAGYLEPGFGSIESISTESVISAINDSNADFLIVALGARKGHLWIERNKRRLNCPVISHLGAVVSFVAGSVRRAPPWIAAMGFEWLWRASTEPRLIRRYVRDGAFLLRSTLSSVIPLIIRQAFQKKGVHGAYDHALARTNGDEIVLTLSGHIDGALTNRALRESLTFEGNQPCAVTIDVSAVRSMDGHAIATMYTAVKQSRSTRIRLLAVEGSTGAIELSRHHGLKLIRWLPD